MTKPPASGAPKRRTHPTSLSTKNAEELTAARKTYGRGNGISTGAVKDKKLRGNLKKIELRYREAASAAADAEILRPEDGPGFIEAEGELERTWKLRQEDIRKAVDVATAQKGFDLKLGFGQYSADYTRDGKDLLLAGRKGHVATFDWREGTLGCELQLGETVRDARWLHNDHFFAVAQKKYVYIYDRQGVEIHCLKKHIEVTHMEFLPYHFLLATVGNAGYLKYQDTSTGTLVAELRTKLGPATAMTQNRRNAVIHVGHGNGTVTLWSPNMATPLVTMLTHKGPVRAVAVDRGGYYMATAGADSRMNIFDIRAMKEVHSYFTPTPATTLAISDTGLLGVGWGAHVTLWKDALKTKQNSPYLSHHQDDGSAISNLRFCPFDDILGTGHAEGFSSLIVPGAGEPNFDSFEVNPYATKKARQEGEVRALLEKLRPEMIQLDPDFVGKIDLAHAERKKEQTVEAQEKRLQEGLEKDEKYRTRGKNSALRRFLRKKSGKNVRDERRDKLERLKLERQNRNKGKSEVSMGAALDRFKKKR
ncbi:WD40-repeat-containing domain protein [Sphaerosporella brunnea]|uniref:U three protein 7 n=1 Tax=Sphaerosporella brunnea TaxID=1250544 RepID=A0A5J5F5B3_9PEZI|nr:WD40-repeat-containing domain protein [Sphaerosporella brunnea]